MSGKPLTPLELKDRTGYAQPKRQAEWIRRELGIEPPIGADGYPKVTQEVIDQATLARRVGAPVGGTISASMPAKLAGPGPKWTIPA